MRPKLPDERERRSHATLANAVKRGVTVCNPHAAVVEKLDKQTVVFVTDELRSLYHILGLRLSRILVQEVPSFLQWAGLAPQRAWAGLLRQSADRAPWREIKMLEPGSCTVLKWVLPPSLMENGLPCKLMWRSSWRLNNRTLRRQRQQSSEAKTSELSTTAAVIRPASLPMYEPFKSGLVSG